MLIRIKEFIDKYLLDIEDEKIKLFNMLIISGITIACLEAIICTIISEQVIWRVISTILIVTSLIVFSYINKNQQDKISSLWICTIISLITIPLIIIAVNEITSPVNYYYVIAIVLPFLFLDGKCLFIFTLINTMICVSTYGFGYYYLASNYIRRLHAMKYVNNVRIVLFIGLSIGCIFYYQIHIYKKKQKENEEQRILLEQAVHKIKLAKQEAEEAKREADLSNKAKSEFLANMSHEIRTPMNAILGIATLISRDDINRSVRDKVEGIQSATRSLLAIVNDILDISKIESGKMEIVEEKYQVSSVIHDAVNMVKYRLEDRPIELKVKVDETLPCELYGDSIRIRQILTNLLSNAEKYTTKGSITLSINWELHEDAAKLIIKVKDTGIGIKEQDIKNIFNTFERVDIQKNHTLEGTGLGLSICHKLLEMMGGMIFVESEYGVGTTFTVVLYQKIENVTPIEMISYEQDDKEESRYQFVAPEARVLVVDDNLVNLRVAKGLLELHHLQIETATSGEEALTLLEHNYYDLVFMDHMMPKLDGIETMRIIQKEKEKYNLDIPIIAFTANAVSGVKEMFLKEGFKAYLSKPIEVKKLDDILLKFLPSVLIKRNERLAISETEKGHKDKEKVSDKMVMLQRIKAINLNQGMKYVEYNEELYIDILKTYVKETRRIIKELTGVEEKNLKDFETTMHAIKGSSQNLGVTKIASYAKRLESAAHLKDIHFIKEKYVSFEVQLNQVLNEIDEFIATLEGPRAPVEEKTLQEVVDIEKIKLLYQGFENYDIEAMEAILKEFEVYQFPKQTQEFLDCLRECVENLEYELGMEAINQYLSTVN